MTRHGVGSFLLVCALLGGAFYALLEPHSETVEGPLRGEAATNPYLALTRLLEAMGFTVTTRRDLDEIETLPAPDATLFLLAERDYLTEKHYVRLRDWVERGGHLIVQAWQPSDDELRRADPLLDTLGVSFFAEGDDEDEDGEDPEEAAEEPTDDEAASPPRKDDALARWSPEPGVELRIDFDARRTLVFHGDREWEAAEIWSDDAGDHGCSIPLGAGHVTVWSDGDFLRNEGIGRWDHAELAYRLARMFDSSGTTWIIVRDAARLSLVTRLLESAWSVCIALGAWLLFYLWSVAPRFGPVQPDPPTERRELMEHVRASGSFLLRNGGFDTLVSAVRSALLRRVQQRHPQWLLLDARARVQRVAEHTGLAADEIEDALESATSTRRDTLVKRIATLEAIRKRL
jgi:hypothetical protein